MKTRTASILRAAEILDTSGEFTRGICNAIAGGQPCGRSANARWFESWFRPEDHGFNPYWLGPFSQKNLLLRYTFIAMAAAVSETED